MDLSAAIAQLYAEKAKTLQAIAKLEKLAGLPPSTKDRRGRKSMDEAERAEVSARMKNYWAQQRAAKAGQDRERGSRS